MNPNIKVPFEVAKTLIKEGDVLLFRKKGGIHTISWWIRTYTKSKYSHVGLAHWHKDTGELLCLEFREFRGSREFPVKQYVKEGQQIDVFRACTLIEAPYIDNSFPDYPELKYRTHKFTSTTASNITSTAHELLGRDYGWWNIWQLIKTYIPFIRLGQNIEGKNGLADEQEFVCSTLVAYSYRVHYIDPVPYVSDVYTTPGDLSRSDLFVKLFEIV